MAHASASQLHKSLIRQYSFSAHTSFVHKLWAQYSKHAITTTTTNTTVTAIRTTITTATTTAFRHSSCSAAAPVVYSVTNSSEQGRVGEGRLAMHRAQACSRTGYLIINLFCYPNTMPKPKTIFFSRRARRIHT